MTTDYRKPKTLTYDELETICERLEQDDYLTHIATDYDLNVTSLRGMLRRIGDANGFNSLRFRKVESPVWLRVHLGRIACGETRIAYGTA